MALGLIFGRFWDQVGRQVEAKFEPKSTKMALQKDVQKMITNLLELETQDKRDLTQIYSVRLTRWARGICKFAYLHV